MAAVPDHGHPIGASIGTILLALTSQGRQNTLQKKRPAHIGLVSLHWTLDWSPYIEHCTALHTFLETLCIDSS